jgi:hypothetical protein
MVVREISPGHRIFTIFSIVVSVLILVVAVGGFFLVRALIDNWMLKYDANAHAYAAGTARARSDFARGRRQILELYLFSTSGDDYSGRVPDDGADEPAGRREGAYEVRRFMVNKSFPAVHREVQASYVEGYNKAMRAQRESPGWNDTNGVRVAKPSRAAPRTNVEAKPTSP